MPTPHRVSRRSFLLAPAAVVVTRSCGKSNPVDPVVLGTWDDVEYLIASFSETAREVRGDDVTTWSWSSQAILLRDRFYDDGVFMWLGTGPRSGSIRTVLPDPDYNSNGSGTDVGDDTDPSRKAYFRIDFFQNWCSAGPGRLEVPAQDDDETLIAGVPTSRYYGRDTFPLPATPETVDGSYSTQDVWPLLQQAQRHNNFSLPDKGEYNGQYTITPIVGPAKIQRITVWINAFIPDTLPSLAVEVPGQQGTTMVPAFFFQDCFATDNRSFSDDIAASSRMQSKIEITVKTGEWTQTHKCDQTIEYDCEDGDVEGTGVGSTDRMSFSDLKLTDDGHRFKSTLTAAGSNPLVAASRLVGDIDYVLDLDISITDDERAAVVGVGGMVDEFPAFEAYAQADDGPIKMLFQRMPDLKARPQWNLGGDANIGASGGATLGAF